MKDICSFTRPYTPGFKIACGRCVRGLLHSFKWRYSGLEDKTSFKIPNDCPKRAESK